MIRRPTLALAALLLAAPAWSASKEDRLQIQIASLQGQVADLQRSLEEANKEIRRLNELLAQQNDSVRKSVADQRTQAESVQTSLKELSDRVAEMSTRLTRATAPPAVPAPADPGLAAEPGTAPATPPPPASAPAPKELYSQAYADYARGNYDLSIQGFQEYLRNYPTTDFSDNAQYWIGECYYGKQKFNDAIEAWKVLFRDYPASDKLPDGHVKTGMALEKLGRRSQALLEYRFVIDRYPNSQAARIARDRLNP